MKRFLFLFLLSFSLASLVYAEDDLKLYGVISYLSNDQSELRIDDLIVNLKQADIEGFLSLGALIKVEGHWQAEIFIADEVEVKRSSQPDVFIYRGQVSDGRLLGLEFPDLVDGDWLELTTKRNKMGDLHLLLVKHLSSDESAVQASVDALTEDGFVAGGVTIVSEQAVAVGDLISISGSWRDGKLLELP